MLLTGDLDGEGMSGIMPYRSKWDCNILKVPHHGGNNLGMEDLIQQSSTSLAVISVGKNKYGHPTQKVLDLLERYDVPVLRTDHNGAITIRTNGRKYSITTSLD